MITTARTQKSILTPILAFCVIFASCVTPTTSLLLVCNLTGQPMAPVFVAETQRANTPKLTTGRRACCRVTEKHESDGTSKLRFVGRSCCHLKLVHSGGVFPTTVSPVSSQFVVAVLATVPLPFVSPATAPVGVSSFGDRSISPRGPPPASASPRAPPVFS